MASFQVLLQLMERIRGSAVEVGSLSHHLQGFCTSQVVPDFFHQQYVSFREGNSSPLKAMMIGRQCFPLEMVPYFIR